MPKNKLNCDPTFELEERIVESSPLHKHYRRKQNLHKRRNNSSAATSADVPLSDATDKLSSHNTAIEEAIAEMSNSFVEYNRFSANPNQISPVDCPPLPQSSSDQINLQTLNCPQQSNSNKMTKIETVC